MSLMNFCGKSLVRISPDASIVEACRLMEEKNVGCLVAERDGKLCGILTDRDIALRVAGAQKNPQDTSVLEIMTSGGRSVLSGRSAGSRRLRQPSR